MAHALSSEHTHIDRINNGFTVINPSKKGIESIYKGVIRKEQEIRKLTDDGKSHLEAILDSLGIVALKPFFIENPQLFKDLLLKLDGAKKNHKGMIADKNVEYDILKIFIRKPILENGGEQLLPQNNVKFVQESEAHTEIFNNKKLIEYATRESSILDTSVVDIKRISIGQRKELIRELLIKGIKQNATQMNLAPQNIENQICILFPQIVRYLIGFLRIKHIPRGLDNIQIQSLNDVTDIIVKGIWGNGKNMQENNLIDQEFYWAIVKGFHAWGSLTYIKEQHEIAESTLTDIPKWLPSHDNGISHVKVKPVKSVKSSWEGTCEIELNSKKIYEIKFKYRAKSLESILKKMWEDKLYNNVDAIQDMIGMVVVFPTECSPDEEKEILSKFSCIMEEELFVVKNKGFLQKSEVKKIKLTKKPGLIITDWEDNGERTKGNSDKGTSTTKIKNIAFAGFTRINNSDYVGFELQAYRQQNYEDWENEHILYDSRKILSSISRSPLFLTPKQVLFLLKEIDTDTLDKKMGIGTIRDVFKLSIEDGFLIPMIINDTQEIIFVTRPRIDEITDRKLNTRRLRKTDIEMVNNFIDSLTLL